MSTVDYDAERLMALGYRRTSNRHGMVSRVDRPDWKEWLAAKGYPVDADWYRRVCSKDTFEIGQAKARRVKSSSNDTTGFVPQ